MVARKTKEDRSVRETQPVVLPVKQKESLSYMNFREFTYIYKCLRASICKQCSWTIRRQDASLKRVYTSEPSRWWEFVQTAKTKGYLHAILPSWSRSFGNPSLVVGCSVDQRAEVAHKMTCGKHQSVRHLFKAATALELVELAPPFSFPFVIPLYSSIFIAYRFSAILLIELTREGSRRCCRVRICFFLSVFPSAFRSFSWSC